MSKDYVVPKVPCPECGLPLDLATAYGNETRTPSPGDFSVCISCMAILRYTVDLQLRASTLAERQEIGPELEAIVKAVQLAQLKRPDLGWGRKGRKGRTGRTGRKK